MLLVQNQTSFSLKTESHTSTRCRSYKFSFFFFLTDIGACQVTAFWYNAIKLQQRQCEEKKRKEKRNTGTDANTHRHTSFTCLYRFTRVHTFIYEQKYRHRPGLDQDQTRSDQDWTRRNQNQTRTGPEQSRTRQDWTRTWLCSHCRSQSIRTHSPLHLFTGGCHGDGTILEHWDLRF